MRTIFHAADGRPSGSSLQAVDKEMDLIKCKSIAPKTNFSSKSTIFLAVFRKIFQEKFQSIHFSCNFAAKLEGLRPFIS
jgi:hypothetical protein